MARARTTRREPAGHAPSLQPLSVSATSSMPAALPADVLDPSSTGCTTNSGQALPSSCSRNAAAAAATDIRQIEWQVVGGNWWGCKGRQRTERRTAWGRQRQSPPCMPCRLPPATTQTDENYEGEAAPWACCVRPTETVLPAADMCLCKYVHVCIKGCFKCVCVCA